jgi:hypothetical protein
MPKSVPKTDFNVVNQCAANHQDTSYLKMWKFYFSPKLHQYSQASTWINQVIQTLKLQASLRVISMTDYKLLHNSTHCDLYVWLLYDATTSIFIYRIMQKLFQKFLHAGL